MAKFAFKVVHTNVTESDQFHKKPHSKVTISIHRADPESEVCDRPSPQFQSHKEASHY